MRTIEEIVQEASALDASDILLSQNSQLFFRVNGEVQPQGDCPNFISELYRLVPRLEEALKRESGAVDRAAGHLVFATLHTKRVYNTISRLIGMALAEEKEDIRSTLANNLLMIICQLLLKRVGGGRVAAREIMIQTDSTANLIREGKEKTIEGVLATHREEGMINLTSSIKALYGSSLIDTQTFAENSGAA
jgi:Tfp pilus assembly pilus retraction ATPase PilT